MYGLTLSQDIFVSVHSIQIYIFLNKNIQEVSVQHLPLRSGMEEFVQEIFTSLLQCLERVHISLLGSLMELSMLD